MVIRSTEMSNSNTLYNKLNMKRLVKLGSILVFLFIIFKLVLVLYMVDTSTMGDRNTFKYFAFGSNLLQQRLTLKNPSAKFTSIGELQNYTLMFSSFGHDPTNLRWRGGGATIVLQPGHSVWGCVWTLDKKDIPSLDKQEGFYDAIQVLVRLPDNTQVTCRTYMVPTHLLLDKYDNRPSPQYLDVIKRGAAENDLPKDYQKFLESLETNGYSGPVDIYQKVIDQLKEPGS